VPRAASCSAARLTACSVLVGRIVAGPCSPFRLDVPVSCGAQGSLLQRGGVDGVLVGRIVAGPSPFRPSAPVSCGAQGGLLQRGAADGVFRARRPYRGRAVALQAECARELRCPGQPPAAR